MQAIGKSELDKTKGNSRTDTNNGNKKSSRLLSSRHFKLFKSSHFLRYGIAQRLLVFIILFSSLVTLIATILQLYLDYQRDVNAIEQQLDTIESSYLNSIGASLWNLDLAQLNLQLEGIMRLPDMRAVEVIETEENVENPLVLKLGEKGKRSTISRQFELTRYENGDSRVIGKIYVEATLKEVYARLVDKAVIILMSQGVKTFLVSMFILYVFYWLVTRHLITISNFVGKFSLKSSQDILQLNRKSPSKEDELDQVVNSFNDMSISLMSAYGELRELNYELEKDIVARKKAEQEVMYLNAVLEERVQRRTADLEATNKELDAFCYSVSHDLRAPLRRVEGFRRILNEEYEQKLDKQGQHYLERIAAGTQEMTEMIDSFLALSSSTRAAVKIEEINLSKIAEDVTRRLQEKDSARIVKTKIEKDLSVKGDAKLLDVLLMNLFDNAWKYTRKRQNARVEFGCEETDSARIFYVKDNGVGFDMKSANRLFTPFARLHNNEDYEGIGVGLATVQRIIARHGGRIWVQSEPDKGTRFCFTVWSREISNDGTQNIVD